MPITAGGPPLTRLCHSISVMPAELLTFRHLVLIRTKSPTPTERRARRERPDVPATFVYQRAITAGVTHSRVVAGECSSQSQMKRFVGSGL